MAPRVCSWSSFLRAVAALHAAPPVASVSAAPSLCLRVLDRRVIRPKSGQNRSESLYAGLWAPCRVLWVSFGPALGLIPVRYRSFRGPLGSAESSLNLKAFGHSRRPRLEAAGLQGWSRLGRRKPTFARVVLFSARVTWLSLWHPARLQGCRQQAARLQDARLQAAGCAN